MGWISLKAAYLAVLWVIEEKLNISSKDRIGQWKTSIGEGKQLLIKRSELAKYLGVSFFDNSIYGSEVDDVMPLGNLIDGSIDISEEASLEGKRQVAFVEAHKTLMNLLAVGTISARSSYAFVMTAEEITESTEAHSIPEASDLSLWKEKPLPNYESSALHMGPNQDFWFFKRRMIIDENAHDVISTGCEYWMTNIQVNKVEFENWLLPQTPTKYQLPEVGVLKLQKGKMYIKFGFEEGEVKANQGLHLLRFILKHGKANSMHGESVKISQLAMWYEGLEFEAIQKSLGQPDESKYIDAMDIISNDYDGEELDSADSFLALMDSENNEAESQLKQDTGDNMIHKIGHIKLRKLVRYRTKMIRFFLEKYWDLQDNLVEAELNSLAFNSNLEKRQKLTLEYAQFTDFLAEKILGEPLELKQIVQVLFSNGQRIDSQNLKKFFDIEETTEEKKLASYKRGIRNELKKLRDEFPSFTKHMGDVAVKSSSGIIVKDDGFIYYPAGDIKWSLD